MTQEDILDYKQNVYSQFGEDGIIQHLFDRIGYGSKICCEFGAWDGIHFSNCRNLILGGWQAVMIEGDDKRFEDLCRNYVDNPFVKSINRFVDTADNNLDAILEDLHIASLDFLSIDIDGLDYQIMESLQTRPRIICVEVNAGHNPEDRSAIPPNIAKDNIGQPLSCFCELAEEMGYHLSCYNGNAFFVQRDICQRHSLPSLSAQDAYRSYLSHLSHSEREWLYLANMGIVPPYYRFHNPYLDASALGIGRKRALALRMSARPRQFMYKRARSLRHILK